MESHSDDTTKALALLRETNQDHILIEFEKRSPEEQQEMVAQILHLDKVTPGGLSDYVLRARRFLDDSKNNVNPFDNYKPEIPDGIVLNPGE